MLTPRLTLVACCAEKLARIAPAREMYRSALFRKAAAWAEQRGDWMILSARYGLIKPSEQLAPYECSMRSLTAEERAAWDHRIAWHLELLANHLDVESLHLTLLAGESYAGWVDLVQPWCTVEQPLAGMPIGRRLQWLTLANEQIDLDTERVAA
ncbi:MAG: hypothetical protein LT106_18720 [Burkholderiaceae bacterium]|nr:hypothetical protein [Burkholderiaceae bacterium]